MSDHPEVPRVEFGRDYDLYAVGFEPDSNFDGDGESMNIDDAVSKFRKLLEEARRDLADVGVIEFALRIEVRPCDCHHDIRGRSKICPLHGDGTLS